MSNYLWVIDAGHGGFNTADRTFTFGDGLTIFEGYINRRIAGMVNDLLIHNNIDYTNIYLPFFDFRLFDRVCVADNIYAGDKRAIIISIHCNSTPEHNGSGFEIWTSPGQTRSDKIANIFSSTYQKNFPQYTCLSGRTKGDLEKDDKFTIIRKTDCPSILLENLFFDNRKEAEFLLSEQGQAAIAETIVEGILLCEKLKPT